MSYQEAIRDNIRMDKDKFGNSIYFPPCRFCGTEVKSLNYIPARKYKCPSCRKISAKTAAFLEKIIVGL